MRQVLLIFLGGAGCISLGLAYVLHAFGPTEAQGVLWGWVSIWLGLALASLTVGIRHSASRIINGISDGTPPSSFVAHWA